MTGLVRGEHYTVIGKTGCGKSAYVMKLVARYMSQYPNDPVHIINHKAERNWNALLKPTYTRPKGYNRSVNWAVLPDDNAELEDYLKRVYVHSRDKGQPALVIIDEGLAMSQNSSAIKTLYTQGRALGLTVVLLTQRPSGINVAAITQSSHIIVFNLFGKADLEKLDGYMMIDLSQHIRPATRTLEGRGLKPYYYLKYDVARGEAVIMPPISLLTFNPFKAAVEDSGKGKAFVIPALLLAVFSVLR